MAELVAALSLGIDLGFGQPMEHVLRQCLIALRLAEGLGLDEKQRAVVYYTALLVNVGCHTDAHEQAKWFGDDIALKSIKYDHEPRSMRMAATGMRFLGAGNPPLHRFRLGLEFVLSGHREVDGMIAHHAAIARTMAEQLSLPSEVAATVGAAYERWDGRGWPGELEGDEVPLAARIAQVAEYVEVANRIGGVAGREAARPRAARRRLRPGAGRPRGGGGRRPPLGSRHRRRVGRRDRRRAGARRRALGRALRRGAPGDRELRRPEVAVFPGSRARGLGARRGGGQSVRAGRGGRSLLRRAGLVHGLGRLGVSNAILDKRGPLGAGEWERVRLQPYLTERMLRQSEALAPIARIAVQHRERLDGSGYPRGLSGAAISREARILAAADAYQAMREPRPHRPELSAEDAAAELRADVRAGRHDAEAVEAVLGAAGHRVPRRREGPAGLTPREVEVLRLLARGLSNKEIAARLVISPKTVANHADHIYAKIDASSRAAAGLFAMQHGLLPEEEFPAAVPA